MYEINVRYGYERAGSWTMTNRVAQYNFTEEQMLEAIKGSNGIITNIATSLGCTWHTANRYIKETEVIKQSYIDECERVIDKAESVVTKALDNNDIQTAKWILGTKGKKRGYTEKTEIEHTGDGLPIKVIVEGVK